MAWKLSFSSLPRSKLSLQKVCSIRAPLEVLYVCHSLGFTTSVLKNKIMRTKSWFKLIISETMPYSRFLPSNSKLPSVRRASVMLPTSLASGMFVRLGEASWWARPLGMPGWRSGLCINTRESIFRRPSWMSFFNCGIWRLRSYSTAVRAGLDKEDRAGKAVSGWLSSLQHKEVHRDVFYHKLNFKQKV